MIKRPDGKAWRFVRGKRPTHESGEHDVDAVWVKEVALYISEAWRSAAGGVLVLMTSYLDQQAVGKELAVQADIGPIIVQKSGRPLGSCHAAFLEAVAVGKRPLMLGVGGAWTGLDLHTPSFPNALTDLVIPLIPFGAAGQPAGGRQSLTNVTYAAYILLRQGLGRVVRSPETPANRRIHLLDVRRHMDEFAGMCQPINRWLARYSNQVRV